MEFNTEAVRECLKQGDLKTLFLEHLGWDRHSGQLEISVDDHDYTLTAVAQKRGFAVYTCPVIPDRKTRLKIDRKLTPSAREHLLIYIDAQRGEQVWQWVRRELGKPPASRELALHKGQSGEPLVQRLRTIAVSLEEEEEITLTDMTSRVRSAFDVDKVTKRFYDQFKTKHAEFLRQIKGIDAPADREWYTSLMLNRLMFVYFIQKKGFLDNDQNYLRNRLKRVQALRGANQFHSFYRYFLLRLFHEGLGTHPSERQLDPAFEQLLGKVPYLDGGFFEVHELEKRYPNIEIPDEAFAMLFDFFDQYAWHLDERPLRADNEVNPDVIGYIFEKYVNQKQMGAYYTKEDITEYISKNTIIPFLLDAARQKCAIAFQPDSALWRLLRDDPDRYIYPAVRHGVVREDGSLVPESELPDFVQQGMHDPNARMHDKRYNLEQAPAGDPIRLVTETWREYVHRRQRCLEIRRKLQTGEVHTINDLITLNLDIWQFARDAILQSEGPELLRAFWHALQHLSVLDPTCGSGAFLFAALNILETLYSDCLERMQQFLDDLEGKPHHPDKFRDFRNQLHQVQQHPNERYFILKSIIINNLYGVDIMEEAVEICKLRLFLKLAAQVECIDQIEPLPDIDFNIRAGNTLVGFATLDEVRKSQEGKLALDEEAIQRIEEEAALVEKAYNQFRAQQTQYGGRVTAADKQRLRHRLRSLTDQLDEYLALLYGVNLEKPEELAAWKASHQPFHWFAEFYGILRRGGFDVIIGNPPYVEYSKVKNQYTIRQFYTEKCGNLYAFVTERSCSLLRDEGYFGMIVPISLPSTPRTINLRSIITRNASAIWCANFADRPGTLFNGVHQKLSIVIFQKYKEAEEKRLYTTAYKHWYGRSDTGERTQLFPTLIYTVPPLTDAYWCKSGHPIETNIYERILSKSKRLSDYFAPSGKFSLYLSMRIMYWCKCFTESKQSQEYKQYAVSNATEQKLLVSLLNSTLYFWFWEFISDGWHITSKELDNFFFDLDSVSDENKALLTCLCEKLMADLEQKKAYVGTKQTQYEYYHRMSKPIIDEIDRVLAQHYGFTDEELDFIINYDIKYRMGGGAEENEE